MHYRSNDPHSGNTSSYAARQGSEEQKAGVSKHSLHKQPSPIELNEILNKYSSSNWRDKSLNTTNINSPLSQTLGFTIPNCNSSSAKSLPLSQSDKQLQAHFSNLQEKKMLLLHAPSDSKYSNKSAVLSAVTPKRSSVTSTIAQKIMKKVISTARAEEHYQSQYANHYSSNNGGNSNNSSSSSKNIYRSEIPSRSGGHTAASSSNQSETSTQLPCPLYCGSENPGQPINSIHRRGLQHINVEQLLAASTAATQNSAAVLKKCDQLQLEHHREIGNSRPISLSTYVPRSPNHQIPTKINPKLGSRDLHHANVSSTDRKKHAMSTFFNADTEPDSALEAPKFSKHSTSAMVGNQKSPSATANRDYKTEEKLVEKLERLVDTIEMAPAVESGAKRLSFNHFRIYERRSEEKNSGTLEAAAAAKSAHMLQIDKELQDLRAINVKQLETIKALESAQSRLARLFPVETQRMLNDLQQHLITTGICLQERHAPSAQSLSPYASVQMHEEEQEQNPLTPHFDGMSEQNNKILRRLESFLNSLGSNNENNYSSQNTTVQQQKCDCEKLAAQKLKEVQEKYQQLHTLVQQYESGHKAAEEAAKKYPLLRQEYNKLSELNCRLNEECAVTKSSNERLNNELGRLEQDYNRICAEHAQIGTQNEQQFSEQRKQSEQSARDISFLKRHLDNIKQIVLNNGEIFERSKYENADLLPLAHFDQDLKKLKDFLCLRHQNQNQQYNENNRLAQKVEEQSQQITEKSTQISVLNATLGEKNSQVDAQAQEIRAQQERIAKLLKFEEQNKELQNLIRDLKEKLGRAAASEQLVLKIQQAEDTIRRLQEENRILNEQRNVAQPDDGMSERVERAIGQLSMIILTKAQSMDEETKKLIQQVFGKNYDQVFKFYDGNIRDLKKKLELAQKDKQNSNQHRQKLIKYTELLKQIATMQQNPLLEQLLEEINNDNLEARMDFSSSFDDIAPKLVTQNSFERDSLSHFQLPQHFRPPTSNVMSSPSQHQNSNNNNPLSQSHSSIGYPNAKLEAEVKALREENDTLRLKCENFLGRLKRLEQEEAFTTQKQESQKTSALQKEIRELRQANGKLQDSEQKQNLSTLQQLSSKEEDLLMLTLMQARTVEEQHMLLLERQSVVSKQFYSKQPEVGDQERVSNGNHYPESDSLDHFNQESTQDFNDQPSNRFTFHNNNK